MLETGHSGTSPGAVTQEGQLLDISFARSVACAHRVMNSNTAPGVATSGFAAAAPREAHLLLVILISPPCNRFPVSASIIVSAHLELTMAGGKPLLVPSDRTCTRDLAWSLPGAGCNAKVRTVLLDL